MAFYSLDLTSFPSWNMVYETRLITLAICYQSLLGCRSKSSITSQAALQSPDNKETARGERKQL